MRIERRTDTLIRIRDSKSVEGTHERIRYPSESSIRMVTVQVEIRDSKNPTLCNGRGSVRAKNLKDFIIATLSRIEHPTETLIRIRAIKSRTVYGGNRLKRPKNRVSLLQVKHPAESLITMVALQLQSEPRRALSRVPEED